MSLDHMTTKEAADYVRSSPSTLAKRRITGQLPQFTQIGKAVRYRRADLDAWMSDNVRTSTSADTSPASPPAAASLWQAFVQAQERSKATGDLNDGIAAGKAYAAFVADFTRPTAKGAA